MSRLIRRTLTLPVAVCLLLVAGCTTTPPPTFYQLEEPASAQLAGIERGLAIGVGPLSVAAYLDRPQIVTRAAAHRLKLSEANVWAEPLKESILRVIAVNLSNMLETNRVFRIPRRDQAIPLAYRVEVGIARFDGTLDKEVRLTARWTLYNGDDQPLLTRVTIVSEPTGGPGYEPFIAALNRSLHALSREIADAIRSNN